MPSRTYRAGESLEDYCRACKTDRMHTVVAADPGGQPIRVVCGFCGSEHNYRGGPRAWAESPRLPPPRSRARAHSRASRFQSSANEKGLRPPMTDLATPDLEMLLRRIIREEAGITAVAPAEKWRGGTIALRPGKP